MIGKGQQHQHYVHVHIEMTGDPLKIDCLTFYTDSSQLEEWEYL